VLGQRIVTAVVMLALLLPALVARSPSAFIVLTMLLIGAAGWEWMRLNGSRGFMPVLGGAALGVACAANLWLGWPTRSAHELWWAASALWLFGGAFALRSGPAGWSRAPRLARAVVGLLVLWLAWSALVLEHGVGVNFVLSVLCIVWVADISAYFGGRAFGRTKLAPTISPGKTWEGVASGLIGVWLLALLWLAADQRWAGDSASVFTILKQRVGWIGMAVAVSTLMAMSVVGDLFESLVKRAAGAKDSSGLLPGHGGVLDRIDALMPVLPIALALTSL
jgi:phosphatidate cytidylyltransferase